VHPYNKVFLLSLESALKADRHWDPVTQSFAGRPIDGLRTFARIYAGWGVGEEFYRTEAYLKQGYATVEVRGQTPISQVIHALHNAHLAVRFGVESQWTPKF
jgi:hypothetical protein